MRKNFLPIGLVSVLLVGQPNILIRGANPPPQLIITSAVADLDAMTLFIEGVNLGPNPTVLMGNVGATMDELIVLDSTDTSILAELITTDPGTYLLSVSTGPGMINFFSMDVTLGPVGPQGLPGEQGPQGPPGISGLQRIVATDGPSDSPPGVERTLNVSCPPNKKILGGGCKCQAAFGPTEPLFFDAGFVILASFPNTDTSRECVCTKETGSLAFIEAYALCGDS